MRIRWEPLLLIAALIGGPGTAAGQSSDTTDGGLRLETDAGPTSSLVIADAGPRDAAAEDDDISDAGPSVLLGPVTGEAPTVEDEALPEGHEADLTLELSPTEGLQTGDLLRAEITVTVADGDDVAVPEQDLGELELYERSYTQEVTPDGRRQFHFILELLPLAPGETELPALRVRVVTAQGEVGFVRTEPQTIDVGSRLANEPDAQPRPPTEPLTVMVEDYTLAWILGVLGALLLTALIAFLFGRWWRRRPRKAGPPPPPRPPWELALEALEELRREKSVLMEEQRQGEFVDRVSDTVREYLGHRFGFNGLESTSDEVVARLRRVELRAGRLEAVQALLADSDLVKFARLIPEPEQCDRMLLGALEIVRGTMPTAADVQRATRPSTPVPAASSALGDDGTVAIPLSVPSLDEAERALEPALDEAAAKFAGNGRWSGTVCVFLSAELPNAAATDEALVSLHARLSERLREAAHSSDKAVRLRLEHLRGSFQDAALAGGGVPVTVVDDRGARHERRSAGRSEREGSPSTHDLASSKSPSPDAVQAAMTQGDESLEPSVVGEENSPSAEREPAASEVSSPKPARNDSDVEGEDRTSGQAQREPSPPRDEATDAAPPPAVRAERSPSLRILEVAFPEAASRVRPVFAPEQEVDALFRWVTGLEHPVAYELAEGWLGPDALRGMKLSRRALHERAVEHLAQALPNGFAPKARPAYLEGGAETILALPSRVTDGDAWLAFPLSDGTLVVMQDGTERTADELRRLRDQREGDELFERPVRVTSRGFEPVDWPDDDVRARDDSEPPSRARPVRTLRGGTFGDAIVASKKNLQAPPEDT